MTRPALIALILLSVSTNALAQILLRLGARSGLGMEGGVSLGAVLDAATRPGILGGLACYGLSVVVWIYVLSIAEVSFAYPFLGLGFVFVATAAWYFLGEPLSIQRLSGTALIAFGVILLAGS